jgi:hypothetical protein
MFGAFDGGAECDGFPDFLAFFAGDFLAAFLLPMGGAPL